ncbi:hypothetical protein GW765_04065 [Candidatus Parcubacteria bacterium]|nr:hypothetical protein [Candidatus Parcubacteria bacterium]
MIKITLVSNLGDSNMFNEEYVFETVKKAVDLINSTRNEVLVDISIDYRDSFKRALSAQIGTGGAGGLYPDRILSETKYDPIKLANSGYISAVVAVILEYGLRNKIKHLTDHSGDYGFGQYARVRTKENSLKNISVNFFIED